MLIRAKKSLGQNWLINPHILDKVVATAEISKDDIILEVGPGTGLLTKKLAEILRQGSGQEAGRVIAIEKDHRLIEPLKEKLGNYPNVEILEGDVLNYKTKNYILHTLKKYHKGEYKIVANIPYYITSNFLRKVFEEWPQPKLIVLTIQKEVAQRIIAKPPHINLLALSVQYYTEPEIIGFISKNNFRPVPKVDSAIIRLTTNDQRPTIEQSKKLFKLIKIGFSEKRKQLASVLSKKLKIDRNKIIEAFLKVGIKETARAENLSLEQWENLRNLIDNNFDLDRITNKVIMSHRRGDGEFKQ